MFQGNLRLPWWHQWYATVRLKAQVPSLRWKVFVEDKMKTYFGFNIHQMIADELCVYTNEGPLQLPVHVLSPFITLISLHFRPTPFIPVSSFQLLSKPDFDLTLWPQPSCYASSFSSNIHVLVRCIWCASCFPIESSVGIVKSLWNPRLW